MVIKTDEKNLIIKNTLVLIPAYNEEVYIKNVIKECQNHFENILVVDDGSTDNTFKEISQIKKILDKNRMIYIHLYSYYLNINNLIILRFLYLKS